MGVGVELGDGGGGGGGGAVAAAMAVWWGCRWWSGGCCGRGGWSGRCGRRAAREPLPPLRGDLPENARLNAAARSRPSLSPLPHRIVPRVFPLFHRVMELHGKISFIWFGPTPRVTVTDPELVREVLSNKFGHFEKPAASPLVKLLADGLANYEGEKWARHRRILNRLFISKSLRTSRETSSPELLSVAATKKDDEYFSFNQSLPSALFRLFSICISQLQENERDRWRDSITPKRHNRKREKAIKVGEATNDDLLGLMLESNMRYFEENANSNLKMSTDEVIEECKLFYFAGQETTSVLLTWTMVALSMHPEWQARAREEVLQVFGNSRPDFEGLSRLKIVSDDDLLRGSSTLPPVIFLNRKTYKEMKLGGITYPPGVTLMLLTIFLHHDPDIWGKDASEFRPERFAEGISKASKDQVAFFPFGWGPAFVSGKVSRCSKLRWAQHDPSAVHLRALSIVHSRPYTVITLQPQHGAQINFRRL
uniref:Uncharacterized protein n=1 Tax=Ananas comosus var. bracteatus TaxID=296719 RepID=A0A6V7NYY9_ANACO|nr:unnamed protein product [Ananas comosus var. bracteatus]